MAPEEQHPKPQARAEPQQSDSERPEVVGVDGHRIVLGGRVALTGMRKKTELEGKTCEVESIMEEQGKVRLRMDCGRRVLVSLDRVRVQEVEHMKGAEDSKAAQQQHQGEETKGRGVAVDHEPHGRKEERSEEGEMGGQEETFELWNGVRLVGMRQPELEGHKGVLEEIYKDKVQVLLVGGMRRVKVDKKKVVPEVFEPVEVLPPGFEGWSFLEQIGVGSAPTMDEVKAAYKKWVLRLHPDKNMNNVAKATHLFKMLTSGYEGWKGAPGSFCGEAEGPAVPNIRVEWGLATVRVHRRGHRRWGRERNGPGGSCSMRSSGGTRTTSAPSKRTGSSPRKGGEGGSRTTQRQEATCTYWHQTRCTKYEC